MQLMKPDINNWPGNAQSIRNRMLIELERRTNEHNMNFIKELENIKKNQVRVEDCNNWNKEYIRRWF